MLQISRDSVCMADDVTAPNCEILDLRNFLSTSISYVINYLPKMPNSVWILYAQDIILGYLSYNEYGSYTSEIINDVLLSGIPSIYCKYIPIWKLHTKQGTLIERAKQDVKEMI